MKAFVVALLVAVGILAGFYGGFKFGQNNVSANAKISNGTSSGRRSGANFGGNGRNLDSGCPSPGAPSPAAGTNAFARGSITDLASGSLRITTPNCDVKVSPARPGWRARAGQS